MRAPARTSRAALSSILLIGVFSACSGYGVFGAFSSSTQNPASAFSIGTVTIADNDTGTALYSLTNVIPEEPNDRCIKVTYTGNLGASVKVYRGSLSGSLGPYVTLTVTKGTGDNPTCADFSAGTDVYSGTLSAFPASSGGALALTNAASSATWSANNAVTYRFRVEVVNNTAAQNLSTGTHAFTWESTEA